MRHQSESKPNQPLAAPETTHTLLAAVTEISREHPRYGALSKIAMVMLYEGAWSQTCVEIPVRGIVNQLDHASRYMVEIKFRPMEADEELDPTTVQRQIPCH